MRNWKAPTVRLEAKRSWTLVLSAICCAIAACRGNGQPQGAQPAQPRPSPEERVAATIAEPPRVSASSSSRPRLPVQVGTRREPALFARVGDALMPLGCKRGAIWASGEACITGSQSEVKLHPRPKGEPETLPATPALIEFPVSDTSERGLHLARSANMPIGEIQRPLLGFGTIDTVGPVRFSGGALLRLQRNAARWCSKTKCEGLASDTEIRLKSREARPEEKREAAAIVRQALAAGLGEQPPITGVSTLATLVGGQEHEVFDLDVDSRKATGRKATALELPTNVHFLVARTPEGYRRLSLVREHDFGLGEAGELLAAVDLDGDGTDELILEWRYSEGRWLQFARRDGDQLVVIGSFGDGT